jgi:hypothetical protein
LQNVRLTAELRHAMRRVAVGQTGKKTQATAEACIPQAKAKF